MVLHHLRLTDSTDYKTGGPDEVILGLLTVQRVSAPNVRVAQTIFRQTLKK